MTTKKQHAYKRPPSSAERWLSCHASTIVVPLYPNDQSDASTKGDYAHEILDTSIMFGIHKPATGDPDLNENIALAMDWIMERRREYGEKCQVFPEQQLDIPETGEFGTADIVMVSPSTLHISDYKNGYVPVEIRMNAQLLNYLCGAIAKYGERKTYKITIIQPNNNHIDGPIRTDTITQEDLDWFRGRVAAAMQSEKYAAGAWCKKTYCPHRGACSKFNEWAKTEGADAWFTSELGALSDDALADALDHAEILQGLRDEMRKEAMRRMLSMDRSIRGYKMVKGRQDRSFTDEEAVKAMCLELGANTSDLYESKFTSVAGVERFIKKYAEKLGRGAWKKVWENTIKQYVREYTGGLTLERATDGRPAHKRGNEFGPIVSAPETDQTGLKGLSIL